MDNNTRYVIGGSELGRAPALKKCPMCGGVADYIAEARRRRCLYCAEYVPVDTDGRDLGSAAPFVCALTREQIENPGSRSCRQWRDGRETGK